MQDAILQCLWVAGILAIRKASREHRKMDLGFYNNVYDIHRDLGYPKFSQVKG